MSITHFAEVFELNNLLYGLSVFINQRWFRVSGDADAVGKMTKIVHKITEIVISDGVSRCNQSPRTYHTRRNQI